MNLEYLEKELLSQRKKEIKEGKNLGTRQPIYVVLDLQENYCSCHNDFVSNTNYCNIEQEHGYVDMSLEPEEREFKETDKGMEEPEEVTKFFTDRFVAFFLTSKAAHEYNEYQSHNMNDPYVYVFYSGYRNQQMDKLLDNE